MTIPCDRLDDLLLEGDRYSLEIAARHAATCDACTAKLADWNEISGTAHEMQTTWNSDLLWPRIERALREERRAARFPLTQIAAALAIFAFLSGGVWLAGQRMRNRAFDKVIINNAALDDVEHAEKQHVAAIDHLEQLTEAKLEQPKTPLLVSYKEKLMMLDDAIGECQRNIDQNRQNAYLRRQLLSMYSEKQRTLQDVLREGDHVSNP
jgi:hypothetical protein